MRDELCPNLKSQISNIQSIRFYGSGVRPELEEKMQRLTSELGDLFAENHRLEAGIREKLAAIGFNVKEG